MTNKPELTGGRTIGSRIATLLAADSVPLSDAWKALIDAADAGQAELQELRRSYLALRGEIEDVQAQLYEAENRNEAAAAELQERRKADNDEPFGFVTKRCAEHMHDDDRDENNWMWSISAVVIGCNPKLKHEVPVYLHPASSSKEGA
ncbi:hypothetical protein IYP81_000767 [Salmonella enterica]|nr:hypothetical protein [Salmonella enterica]EBW8697960.1 hypothetical protein [Salmonella enterica subsp. diarizonae serovar 16:z10:e,n,x,z15]EAU0298136.1 hypothetical protein [Salmonella enterica]EGG5523115.1 hypothetical protein [Salmonella enterica]EGP2646661.1 hypothetical protein [Salmonella enterica]